MGALHVAYDADLIARQDNLQTMRVRGVYEDRHADELAALNAKAEDGGRALSIDEAYQRDKLAGLRNLADFIDGTRDMEPRKASVMALSRATGMICAEADIHRQRSRLLEDRIAALEAARTAAALREAKRRIRVPAVSRRMA